MMFHQARESGARRISAPGSQIHGRQIILVGSIIRRYGQGTLDIINGCFMIAGFVR